MLTAAYTTPLVGTPYYRNQGIIKVVDRYNRKFNVGEITLERFDDQNYQYLISPYWDQINYIPNGVFNGIPGINMDIKQDCYYRVNMTPSFISMRTPSESREDIMDLLSSVGLDYYDRFEWLLRSNSRCGDDNIIVVRKEEARDCELNSLHEYNISKDDIIRVNNLGDISNTNGRMVEKIYMLLQSGAHIYIKDENRFLEDNEKSVMLYLLMNMMLGQDRNNVTHRIDGINQAKENGKYLGRKPISVDSILLKQVIYEFRTKLITEQDAMEKLGISSRSTFYRKIKTLS